MLGKGCDGLHMASATMKWWRRQGWNYGCAGAACGLSEQSRVAEVIRQTDRDTRAAGDKSMSRHRFADLPEIIIDDSVHYDEPPTCRGFNFERSADCPPRSGFADAANA